MRATVAEPANRDITNPARPRLASTVRFGTEMRRMKLFLKCVGIVVALLALASAANAQSNLALGKTATQSSTYPGGYEASRAIDGAYDTFSHTNIEYQAWWQVDLGSISSIGTINVFNILPCCQDRLSNFYVLVSDLPFASTDLSTALGQSGVSSYYSAAQAGNPSIFSVFRTGRYVRVQLAGTNYLHIAEVEVKVPTLASGKTATQSSTFAGGYEASRAIDGAYDTFSHTNNDYQAWWQVDLGSISSIGTINVFNILPCCQDRLSNFYVLVSDVPFASTDLSTALGQSGVSSYYSAAQAGSPSTFAVFRTGRYVRVQIVGTNYLHIAEVEVNAPSPTSLASATFMTMDSTTQGNWKGVYGADGYSIAGDSTSLPSYAGMTLSETNFYQWDGAPTDVRAPQRVAAGRIAATWHTGTALGSNYDINLTLPLDAPHQIAVYVLDWDSYYGTRQITLEIRDAATNDLLDSRTLGEYTGGKWLVWNITGSVRIKVINNVGGSNAVLSAVMFAPVPVTVTPAGFNGFETATAAGSVTGVIHTKVAGSSFSVALAALDTSGTAVLTTFTGNVKVELLDASNNSGALTAGCRSTWQPITGSVAVILAFVGADAGRTSATLAEANAYRDVRLRMSYPATGTPTVVACSTDNFAVRPASFASLSAADSDWQTAGTSRNLANLATSGGAVHKAGQPFTVRATAVNAAAATTSNYAGTPVATLSACAGAACPSALDSLAATSWLASAGAINSSATYSEVGAFTLQLTDASFAGVDAADGSTAAERTIASPALEVGRFVPDHYDLALLNAPVLKTFGTTSCAARSFTYVGQPFGYASAPQATVIARNAAGAATMNYSGTLWKLTAASVAQGYTPLVSATPGLDASAATQPAVSSSGGGSGVIAGAAADLFKFSRPTSAPLAPFNAAIALTWSVADGAESGFTGNGILASAAPLSFANIAFDSGNAFRFGVLHLASAYGSELLALPLVLEAQYWDGLRFATHTADQCTALASTSTAMANYQRNLQACETAPSTTTTTLVNGRGYLRLAKPGAGNNGSVDLALQLGASAAGNTCASVGASASAALPASLPWLQGKWSGASTYDQNPAARASFGQYRSPMIYLRQSY